LITLSEYRTSRATPRYIHIYKQSKLSYRVVYRQPDEQARGKALALAGLL
jgi:hypothetical protein